MKRYLELMKRHKDIMDKKNIIICIYTNASGFLWSMNKLDSGTDLGWCESNGNDEWSGSFKTYEDAIEDAINLITRCDLVQFVADVPKKEFHWGCYAHHLNNNYR